MKRFDYSINELEANLFQLITSSSNGSEKENEGAIILDNGLINEQHQQEIQLRKEIFDYLDKISAETIDQVLFYY